MRGLPGILSLSLFRKGLNKFNKTGTRMLDSIYHMTSYYLKPHFLRGNISILPFLCNAIMDAITLHN